MKKHVDKYLTAVIMTIFLNCHISQANALPGDYCYYNSNEIAENGLMVTSIHSVGNCGGSFGVKDTLLTSPPVDQDIVCTSYPKEDQVPPWNSNTQEYVMTFPDGFTTTQSNSSGDASCYLTGSSELGPDRSVKIHAASDGLVVCKYFSTAMNGSRQAHRVPVPNGYRVVPPFSVSSRCVRQDGSNVFPGETVTLELIQMFNIDNTDEGAAAKRNFIHFDSTRDLFIYKSGSEWKLSTDGNSYIGDNYHFSDATMGSWFRWKFETETSGNYKVFAQIPAPDTGLIEGADNVTYTISYHGGTLTETLNQGNGIDGKSGLEVDLTAGEPNGILFNAGQVYTVELRNGSSTSGNLLADRIRLIKQ